MAGRRRRAAAVSAVLTAVRLALVLQVAAADDDGSKEESCAPERADNSVDCPAHTVASDVGDIFVAGAAQGSPTRVVCPPGYEYTGPQLECGWVMQHCMTMMPGQKQTNCWKEYAMVERGKGLKHWPHGVPYTLLSPPPDCNEENIVTQHLRHSKLPQRVNLSNIECQKQEYVGLTFQDHDSLRHPIAGDKKWRITFRNVAVVDGEDVNLVIEKVGMLPLPSANETGVLGGVARIAIAMGRAAKFNFKFVGAITGKPRILNKAYITLFDVDDGIDGTSNKQIVVGGMSEYITADDCKLRIERLLGGLYSFASDGINDQLPGLGAATMWQDSLKRSVVLGFKDMSNFTLEVRAIQGEACHDAVKGDDCYDDVQWAMTTGIREHREWYPTLTDKATFADFQQVVHWSGGGHCAPPCRHEGKPAFLEFAGWSALAEVGARTAVLPAGAG